MEEVNSRSASEGTRKRKIPNLNTNICKPKEKLPMKSPTPTRSSRSSMEPPHRIMAKSTLADKRLALLEVSANSRKSDSNPTKEPEGRKEPQGAEDPEESEYREETEEHEEPEEESEHLSDEDPLKSGRQNSSQGKSWLPLSLANNCFYSPKGQLFSKEVCETNLTNAFKNKKTIEWYDFLKLAETPAASSPLSKDLLKMIAVMAKKVEILERSSRSEPEVKKKKKVLTSSQSHYFDMEAAELHDKEEVLPGGKKIILSGMISRFSSCQWVGKSVEDAMESAIGAVLREIHASDQYMLIYASPETSKKTKYFRLSKQFFDRFEAVISHGFHLPQDQEQILSRVSTIKSMTRNYIDRNRGVVSKKNLQDLLSDFQAKFESDPFFRSYEHNLEHDELEGVNVSEYMVPAEHFVEGQQQEYEYN